MISLDQVILLEEKVENAVAKIVQLNAENAALRRKCAELTNALSAKTEQFSSFQTDQGKIEEGILKALERLNAVENAVHTATAAVQASVQKQPQMPVQQADKTTKQASVQIIQNKKTQKTIQFKKSLPSTRLIRQLQFKPSSQNRKIQLKTKNLLKHQRQFSRHLIFFNQPKKAV